MDLDILGTSNEPVPGNSDPNRDIAPNNTIYIQNLNEKVPIEDLKDSLFNLFEEFGEVLDVSSSQVRLSLNATSE